MENAIALRQFSAAYGKPTSSTPPAGMQRVDRQCVSGPAAPKADLEAAASEIAQLRSDIAGMEAVIGAVKGERRRGRERGQD